MSFRKLMQIVLAGFVMTATTVQASETIATFSDPAAGSATPLFTVNIVTDIITGGWDDSMSGLFLEIPYTGNSYTDAFFVMTDVVYTGGMTGGDTQGGTIKFFEDEAVDFDNPLIQIDFESAYVTPFGFGGMDGLFLTDGVVITGSEISVPLSQQSFAFSFSNQELLEEEDGFTATAAFTSSAVPEPVTVVLLGTGAVILVGRKKKS